MRIGDYIKYLFVFLIFVVLSFLIYHFIFYKDKEKVTVITDILEEQFVIEQSYLGDFAKKNYTFDNPKLILNPYGNSPLTALIMFKTKEQVPVEVIIKGKDDKTTIRHTFNKDTQHILPIYGLYADYNNAVILKVDGVEKEIIIKTPPLPNDFVLPTAVKVNRKLVNDDLIFVSTALKGYNAAYDVNGDPRWYLIGNYAWDIGRLANGHLLLSSNRPIAPPYYTVGLMEMDLTGKIYQEYVIPGGYHHDYYEMTDGNLLVASNKFVDGTVEDYVVLIDRKNGHILKEWDLKEILPQTEGKADMWDPYDWFHNNAVWYDKDNKAIVLSGRHQDAVISIDYDTGKLNWIIGDKTNWCEEMQPYFFTPVGDEFEWQWAQHASMVLPNGDIFILDNGNNRSKIIKNYLKADDNYTRGVIYHLDTEKMTIEQIWQYGKERGSDFYSPYISDVDYLKDNHYLVHSGGIGKLDGKALNVPSPMVPNAKANSITAEILNDEVIFELELPSNFYRAEKMSLYTTNNLKLGKGKRLGSLGVTEPIVEKVSLLAASTIIPEEYEVSFQKEVDRLVFKAKLVEGTKIRIILDRLFDQTIYAATASTRAYTAMCIDIFHEDDNYNNTQIINIARYINNEGLSGRYDIYLKIDNKVYNTGQYVVFD